MGAGPIDPSAATASLDFVERLYAAFLQDPASVDPAWRETFAGVLAADPGADRARLGPSFAPSGLFDPPAATCRSGGCAVWQIATLQERLDRLVHAYRVRGHLAARFDPLDRPREAPPELEPSFHGLSDEDLLRPFSSATLSGTGTALTLEAILARLRETYCRSIGVEFMHVENPFIRTWLQARMESSGNHLSLSREEQLRILTVLTDAVIFEDFIQRKYVGAKRFSLEGAESLVPLLDLALEKAGEQGLDEVVLGMAHRGRLNVLANVIGKSPREIFLEFEDLEAERYIGRGDVKYHMGYTSRRMTTSGRTVHVSLCFNPSHLEFVGPVALGRLRAKQDRVGDRLGDRGMALLIHGDAAMAGQGVVQETLNLCDLPGYSTGGTLHVVVNNQIGFTTSPEEGRSSRYCTAVARMVQAPIFHVNGEDPEAVAQAVRVAMDFRGAFHRDVVIDMYCYRRYGHNEGDEPSFTQPLLYAAIRKRKSVRDGYLEHLLKLGGVTKAEGEQIARERREHLEGELQAIRSRKFVHRLDTPTGLWSGLRGGPEARVRDVPTSFAAGRASELLERLATVPEGFDLHPKLKRFLSERTAMAEGKRPLDWSAAEALALGSIAVEGHRVRLSGQDSIRGTFSHRHASFYDQRDGHSFCPLQNLDPDQAPVEILNSPLSEIGVLGFEYGYTLEAPLDLVLWEAQFGDFCNAAQVIIDQFLCSGEDKWRRLSGLVLLLPHGFEGQGPEHSSARLERFLVLAAEDNIQVAQPSTPAQLFHLLRRQVVRPWRKPLVVLTPKSLLRHPAVVSPLVEFTEGRFLRVLPDTDAARPERARRLLLSSGKVYYDLLEERARRGLDGLALLRLEQFYPLPLAELAAALEPYPAGLEVAWVQEEPENMGAWRFLRHHLGETLFNRHPFSGISRDASASPATGSPGAHRLEQERLLRQACGEGPGPTPTHP